MTRKDYTDLQPVRIKDETGQVVWCGFGTVEDISIAEVFDSNRDISNKENKKEGHSSPHSSAEDTSENSDTDTSRKSSYKQRKKDPFVCLSIAHMMGTQTTSKEMKVFMVMVSSADKKGKVHISQEAIAKVMKISQQSISGYVASLVKKGFIRKTMRKGFGTPDFSLHPEAAWLDKLTYRNTAVEKIKEDNSKAQLRLLKKERDERQKAA